MPEYTRVLLHRLRLTSQRCFLHAQRAAPVTGGTGSEDPEFIQEVADFRKTYLLENRWSADHYASPTYRSAALLDQTVLTLPTVADPPRSPLIKELIPDMEPSEISNAKIWCNILKPKGIY